MKATVQKWGNSLALRIPKAMAQEISVRAGSSVDLSVDEAGELLVKPTPKHPKYSLKALLSKVKPENLHRVADWGAPQGKETW